MSTRRPWSPERARLPIDVGAWGTALVSLSGHKMYGPKGVGLLYVRRRPRVKVRPLLFGGGHERGLRPGTLNVPAIVGLGAAARLIVAEREVDAGRERVFCERLLPALLELGAVHNVAAPTLAQTVNVRLPGIGARALLRLLGDRLAFSTGSACATIRDEPSHVLLAQGLTTEEVHQSIRLSFGRFTSEADIDGALDVLKEAVGQLRKVGSVAA